MFSITDLNIDHIVVNVYYTYIYKCHQISMISKGSYDNED